MLALFTPTASDVIVCSSRIPELSRLASSTKEHGRSLRMIPVTTPLSILVFNIMGLGSTLRLWSRVPISHDDDLVDIEDIGQAGRYVV